MNLGWSVKANKLVGVNIESSVRENTGWNDKIVVLKKTTLQLDFKTFIEKIHSGNLMV